MIESFLHSTDPAEGMGRAALSPTGLLHACHGFQLLSTLQELVHHAWQNQPAVAAIRNHWLQSYFMLC